MSKRRISDQQSARIEKKQKRYLNKASLPHPSTNAGLVITRYGQHALVESEAGILIRCAIRANIDNLVAGDRVVWQAEGDAQGVILSLFPRQTMLGRPDRNGVIKPIAANITQVLVVVACKPDISWALLDSYLVMLEHLQLPACIVLNKIDLQCEIVKHQLEKDYHALGYPIILCTAFNQQYQPLLLQLDDQTSIFVGQSGVGKSSLIAAVLPQEVAININSISKRSELGRHTTSRACFYHLATGGAVIDSPGVREFGLWQMTSTDIAKGYREFKPFLSHCKFRNCNHYDTLGCAVTMAVKDELLSPTRYANYVKLCQQFC